MKSREELAEEYVDKNICYGGLEYPRFSKTPTEHIKTFLAGFDAGVESRQTEVDEKDNKRHIQSLLKHIQRLNDGHQSLLNSLNMNKYEADSELKAKLIQSERMLEHWKNNAQETQRVYDKDCAGLHDQLQAEREKLRIAVEILTWYAEAGFTGDIWIDGKPLTWDLNKKARVALEKIKDYHDR